MLSIPIRFIKSLFVLLLFTVVLTGCKKVTPLENGVLQSGLSGKAGSEQLLSLKIPPAISGFMVEATGSEHVSLELLDSEKVAITGCNGLKCLKQSPQAGDYFIKLAADEDYTNVGIVAAWGGAALTTMDNDVPLTGLAASIGNVILQTFYVPVNSGPLVVEASDSSVVNLEILNSAGQIIKACPAGVACSDNSNSTGLHYLRATAVGAFSELSLKVSWGDANSATMQNGVPLTGLSGHAGDTWLESIFIPENTEGLAVQGYSNTRLGLELVDVNGQFVPGCEYDRCFLANPLSGLYFVRIYFEESAENVGLSASWGGANAAVLKNGESITGLSGGQHQMLMHSLYIPENTEGLAIQGYSNTSRLGLELVDVNGQFVPGCEYERCFLVNPVPGLYFVRTYFDESAENVTLTANW